MYNYFIIVHPSEFYQDYLEQNQQGLDKRIADELIHKEKEGYKTIVLEDGHKILPSIADVLNSRIVEMIPSDRLYKYDKMEHQSYITKEFLLKNKATSATICGFTGFCTGELESYMNGKRHEIYIWRQENEMPDILDSIIKNKKNISNILSKHIECSMRNDLILEPRRKY